MNTRSILPAPVQGTSRKDLGLEAGVPPGKDLGPEGRVLTRKELGPEAEVLPLGKDLVSKTGVPPPPGGLVD